MVGGVYGQRHSLGGVWRCMTLPKFEKNQKIWAKIDHWNIKFFSKILFALIGQSPF